MKLSRSKDFYFHPKNHVHALLIEKQSKKVTPSELKSSLLINSYYAERDEGSKSFHCVEMFARG